MRCKYILKIVGYSLAICEVIWINGIHSDSRLNELLEEFTKVTKDNKSSARSDGGGGGGAELKQFLRVQDHSMKK